MPIHFQMVNTQSRLSGPMFTRGTNRLSHKIPRPEGPEDPGGMQLSTRLDQKVLRSSGPGTVAHDHQVNSHALLHSPILDCFSV